MEIPCLPGTYERVQSSSCQYMADHDIQGHGRPTCLIDCGWSRWHDSKDLIVPDNITILKLPPYSPELNLMESVWQYLQTSKLAFTIFDTYEEILDKCCEVWNFFANDPKRINSITHRDRIMIERSNN